jgi:transcriptional regulator with XRE-family HTH domain
MMKIGRKIRELRTKKKLTQGDIEKRTGLKRSYTSRVENDLTTPSVDTLEKYALALEIPLYRLFYDGTVPASVSTRLSVKAEPYFGSTGRKRSELKAFATALSKMDDFDRSLLVWIAQKFADRSGLRKK